MSYVLPEDVEISKLKSDVLLLREVTNQLIHLLQYELDSTHAYKLLNDISNDLNIKPE
jgi:hypothetical protein